MQPLIVANWKARKTQAEALSWLVEYKNGARNTTCSILLAVPFTVLATLPYREYNLIGCAQDVSAFPEGSYTGEIPATLIKDVASYVLIGHSERREYLKETDALLEKKVAQALEQNLTPIFCVQNPEQAIPQGIQIVAYEPIGAIGSGEPDTPENAEMVAKTIQERNPVRVLYGGSVTSENVADFLAQPSISGVLVGTQSLKASDFISLVNAVS